MIYLDNAATSWPKPPEVGSSMQDMLFNHGGNSGRGTHQAALDNTHRVYQVREKLADFFGAEDPARIVFTANATQAINQALFGLLKPGDHVITSSVEHNAVSRPLYALTKRGVEVTELPVAFAQDFPWAEYRNAFRPNTRLVVTLHASNVTGTLLPIEGIGEIARRHGVPYLVDASQTAGIFPIDLSRLPVDLLAFPGHKGLLGPSGIGALILQSDLVLEPLIYGGTGSVSESAEQPDFLPDALESGTLNMVGIAGLGAALDYLKRVGISNIYRKEQELCSRLIEGLKTISGVKLYVSETEIAKAPIVSFNLGELDSILVGYTLEKTADIVARAGLHCAPKAHRTLGTLEQGTVRFSPSHFTTREEIEQAVEGVRLTAQAMF